MNEKGCLWSTSAMGQLGKLPIEIRYMIYRLVDNCSDNTVVCDWSTKAPSIETTWLNDLRRLAVTCHLTYVECGALLQQQAPPLLRVQFRHDASPDADEDAVDRGFSDGCRQLRRQTASMKPQRLQVLFHRSSSINKGFSSIMEALGVSDEDNTLAEVKVEFVAATTIDDDDGRFSKALETIKGCWRSTFLCKCTVDARWADSYINPMIGYNKKVLNWHLGINCTMSFIQDIEKRRHWEINGKGPYPPSRRCGTGRANRPFFDRSVAATVIRSRRS